MKAGETLRGITKKVEIAAPERDTPLDFYVHLTDNPDGSLNRIYITGPRTDADFRAFTVGIAELINLCLEEGIGLKKVTDRIKYIQGETSGLTTDSKIKTASSILDYLGKMLEERYL